MKTILTRRLPLGWTFVLVPFATVFTSLVFAVLNAAYRGDLSGFLASFGIGSSKAFSYFVYGIGAYGGFLILYAFLKKAGFSVTDIGGSRRLSGKEILLALLSFAVAFVVYVPIQYLCGRAGIPMYWGGSGAAVLIESPVDIALTFLGAVVLGVIGEDFIFRGYLLIMLRQRLRTGWAVLLSVILFASIHLVMGPGITLYILPWGLISCLLFLRTGNVYACVLFHSLNNLIAYLVLPVLMR